ncbi:MULTISPECIES: LytR/AlgR family response regulator transcription factor [Roseivirga]|jgi:DNA-binding LytR/AlgR family response regulator|uniref:LytTR family transcriptional regulator n=1 Tax=Roseivirga spongicola TaxID=333140 RepID=A0A150XH07_9BACT|nr:MULTISPECIES: LytTR family DNA-binding domain-containing protein [Roseivirga]KYG77987.1 LytTR family transcriptional regulator [Roseivirga spongicola]MBO6661197.1 response regulator transcription factor [Roseivirga sp.]MBO6762340.1 response regulator transcription factor [Roseivirga sp.]MBO6908819.1 response regulator transcription factor [Roseivirga sp.]WPZ11719.1 LytTR family DNA-binding domain-containing protein [Roseivirga spongicola]
MKVVVFEDEKLASERLIELIQDLRPNAEILASLKSVEAGLMWLQNNEEPDLIVSDIQLLDGSSFEIFNQHPIKCPVIFTTAYDEYAIKAFQVNSVDYLLKPIQKQKLENALQKYDERTSSSSSQSLDIDKIREAIQGSNVQYKSRFLVKYGQRIKAIPVEQIAYFYSQDKLTYLVTFEGKKLPLDQTLEELETVLNPDNYFRVNRKFIVHFDSVSDIHPYFKGRVKLDLQPESGEDIVISSDKTPLFKQWLDQ